MKAAFFKGSSSGLGALVDFGIRAWEDGSYSHVELVFSDGRSGSSTSTDGGVRFTSAGSINFSDASQWDLLDLEGFDEVAALAWFDKHAGDKYDLWGDAHFVVGLIHENKREEFCSEAVGAALGFEQAWRFDPNALYYALKRFTTFKAA
ncbi:hypothetical protein AB4Y32_25355 [Paraburkholderia phymatum]|uniref:Uncharacterized protein n=1 Tax=Paraburkholderia phymatum TaxID=148447 RepID=A0ACC6U637_9BURK